MDLGKDPVLQEQPVIKTAEPSLLNPIRLPYLFEGCPRKKSSRKGGNVSEVQKVEGREAQSV